ncbi:hypothetical protein AAG570_000165 [Ranatra chinensis]|uniref:Transmembrane protein 11 n=1 Tax=Ranatra chinensis TaxID=642074 RepID=A0ABD0ZD78_9HEMI
MRRNDINFWFPLILPSSLHRNICARDLLSSDTAVIKEVYDGENAHDVFVEELERALDTGYSVIVVEPTRLGDETARWIAVGNCLHKTAVVTGIGTIVSGLIWSDYPLAYAPLGLASLFCTGMYTVSWQFDPCVKYQVYTDSQRLASLALFNSLTSTSPVVLVRRSDTRRKVLHCCVTLASTAFCIWKLFNTLGSN